MKKLNKKGFTLVELLAVIVLLALVMIVAGGAIGNTLKNSKQSALNTFGQRVANAAKEECLSGVLSGAYTIPASGATCTYSAKDTKLFPTTSWGDYQIDTDLTVTINSSDNSASITAGTVKDSKNTNLTAFTATGK